MAICIAVTRVSPILRTTIRPGVSLDGSKPIVSNRSRKMASWLRVCERYSSHSSLSSSFTAALMAVS
jgi:hypothetical protein